MYNVEQCNAVAEVMGNFIDFFTEFKKSGDSVSVERLIELFEHNKFMFERCADGIIEELASQEVQA